MKCMFCNRIVFLYILLLYLLLVSRETQMLSLFVLLCYKLHVIFFILVMYFFFQIFANETETSEALSGFALIEVELININDNEPTFNRSSYNFTYDEEIPVGFVIGTVTVCFYFLANYFRGCSNNDTLILPNCASPYRHLFCFFLCRSRIRTFADNLVAGI